MPAIRGGARRGPREEAQEGQASRTPTPPEQGSETSPATRIVQESVPPRRGSTSPLHLPPKPEQAPHPRQGPGEGKGRGSSEPGSLSCPSARGWTRDLPARTATNLCFSPALPSPGPEEPQPASAEVRHQTRRDSPSLALQSLLASGLQVFHAVFCSFSPPRAYG